ncbi:zinc metalloprotease [Clostridium omnivorum]|uniref:Zinc metalloprotease n=1 Tax=Clostridium omnivorum TaxID=1604902 RepID=A0ABQ5NCG4_9CLOT|nr:zinc metalloprotease [Clostridium sp. E14]
MILIYILGAILGFSILIIGHELGHFTLAKLNGVKVEEFSLGMGPKLFGIKGKETEYLIKAFPIGGYVKMLGEEEKVADARSFSSKRPIQKLSIIAAGPLMNFVLAIVLFAIVAGLRGFAIPVVDKVDEGRPAMTAGIQKGDKIAYIDNKKVSTWEDFYNEVYVAKGNEINMIVLRNGEQIKINVTPVLDPKENRYIIGIYPSLLEKPNIAQSMGYGFQQTKSILQQTAGFFKSIFQRKVSSSDFGGPVTIIRVSAKAAEAGIVPLMYLLAYLSVQLAIFNIIPFPALDGGWIFMLLIEIITGKKLDDNKVGFINYIGFVVLMIIMVLVIIKDIVSPINLN